MAIEWRHVTDPMYSHYEVSNTGLVRLGDNIKKAYKTKHGYQSVMLYNHCRYKHFTIHRLVAMAFIPSNDMERLDVNHKDGNKANNNVENLEWCTRSENHKHAYRTGLKTFTEKQREAAKKVGLKTTNLRTIRTKVACYKDGELVKTFNTIHEAFHWIGSSVCGAISSCCNGKKKTYKGYMWRYV